MASEAAEAAAAAAFPSPQPPSPRSVTKALRDAYAKGYDTGKAQANSDAGWTIDYDRQGGI